MTGVLLFIRDKDKCLVIAKRIKDEVAFCSDDRLILYTNNTTDELTGFIDRWSECGMAVMELSDTGDMSFVKDVRSHSSDIHIMLIASSKISPMMYLTPQIKAASLLLVPYDDKTLQATIREYVRDFYLAADTSDLSQALVIKNRDGEHRISYSKIYYIEIRQKRLCIRLANKEIYQYGTLEELIKNLPDSFIRCHRSFVFNAMHLESIEIKRGIVNLDTDITIPLSRSYKDKVKGYMDGLQGG